MGKIAWLIIKVLSGLAALVGAVMVGWSSVALFYLLTGKVTLYLDQPPPAAGLATVFIIGLILLIGGYKAPDWLDIDRLL